MDPNQSRPAVSKWLWITLIIVILIGAGFAAWYYLMGPGKQTASTASTTTTPTASTNENNNSETKDWRTFQLELTKGSFKYPVFYTITPFDRSDVQGKNYYINKNEKGGSDGAIEEFKISEWIKGPTEEGYVLSKEDRQAALALMQKIYQDQKITPETAAEFAKFHGLEFFPYRNDDLAGLTYIASDDNKSRGFAVFGTNSQDIGLATQYVVSLYNQENNAIVKDRLDMDISDAPEIRSMTAKFNAALKAGGTEPEKVNKEIHQEFIDLMKNTSRENLSFYDQMHKIDLMAKSLTF